MDACNVIEGVKNISVSRRYGLSYSTSNYDNLIQHYRESLGCETVTCDTSEAVCGETISDVLVSGLNAFYAFPNDVTPSFASENDAPNMEIIIPNQI